MATRPIDPDQLNSDEASIPIDHAGEYAVSVSLCDASGCNESDPQWVTVFDDAGAHLLDPQDAAAMRMDAIAADLEQRLQAWEAIYGPRESWNLEAE
jgi:hypothetical protein